MINESRAYQQGLIDGLQEGIDFMKVILSKGVTHDQLVEQYNECVRQSYEAYRKLSELNDLQDDGLFGVGKEITQIIGIIKEEV